MNQVKVSQAADVWLNLETNWKVGKGGAEQEVSRSDHTGLRAC